MDRPLVLLEPDLHRERHIASRDAIDLILLGAIWGASFLFMRVAAPEFGPIPLIAVRVAVGAGFLLAVLVRRGDLGSLSRNAGALTLLGLINSAIPFSLFAFAVLSVTGGFAAVLNATAPLFGALVAFVWLRDRPSRSRAAGLVVGFAGVLVLVWGRLSTPGEDSTYAIAAGLAAAFLYGIAANYARRRFSGTDPLAVATGSLLAATLILIPPAAMYSPAAMPSRVGWWSVIVLGIVCTGIAYVLYFRLLRRIGPARVLTVTYLIPAFGVFWGYLFLDEPVTLSMLAGCGVIFLGIALTAGARFPAAPRSRLEARSETGE